MKHSLHSTGVSSLLVFLMQPVLRSKEANFCRQHLINTIYSLFPTDIHAYLQAGC